MMLLMLLMIDFPLPLHSEGIDPSPGHELSCQDSFPITVGRRNGNNTQIGMTWDKL